MFYVLILELFLKGCFKMPSKPVINVNLYLNVTCLASICLNYLCSWVVLGSSTDSAFFFYESFFSHYVLTNKSVYILLCHQNMF